MKRYTEEEEILIIDLYTKTPTSKINDRNREIIELCDFLKSNGYPCVVSGIRNKMENLKSADPKYTADGRVGRSNISSNLKRLWEEQLSTGFSTLDDRVQWAIETVTKGNHKDETPKWATRKGQAAFRERVLISFDSRCCITGLDRTELIQACHIKPHSTCQKEGRADQLMDVRNGLCMNLLHHRAFDNGLISIDEDHCVMVSAAIDDSDDGDMLKPFDGKKILETPRTCIGDEYLDYHRKNIFIID